MIIVPITSIIITHTNVASELSYKESYSKGCVRWTLSYRLKINFRGEKNHSCWKNHRWSLKNLSQEICEFKKANILNMHEYIMLF